MPFCKVLPRTFKKPVLVLRISAPINEAIRENKVILKKISYIYYQLRFRKDTLEVKALLNFNSKVNAITPAYATKLGSKVCFTNIGA